LRYIFLSIILFTSSFASINNINSFKADFTQKITDEKNKVLSYSGHIVASKPQNAVWTYVNPIEKYVYITSRTITIIEPEIEQVIIRHIDSNFNFFNMIQNAEKISKDRYTAHYQESKFNISTENNILKSISYQDEFENSVEIVFSNQTQNITIDETTFIPFIPTEYDIINN
jgi:outer membrane lipoprotein carrier protein